MLEELKQIREFLTPAPPPPPPKGIREEFTSFLSKYKVMGLAVAFIMGIYLGSLVGSLVDNLVMPIVEFFLPETIDWEAMVIGPFRIGAFIGDLITFVIVAFVIFLLIKLTARMGIE
ncbi:MAG: large conductance mechanosensitive channel protein MscL [Promethearchaeota archaeon]|jgi:large conductance mechanosensitive channel